jgi:hypothetical protein
MKNSQEEKKTTNNEISPVIEKMIDKLDLRGLPEEDLNNFRSNMEMQISRRLGLIILENLNEEGLKEYEGAMSDVLAPDPEKLQEIIKKYIPDFESKVKKGMDEFFDEILKDSSK